MDAIACIDENWNIGKDNKLLFKIKKDMNFFKEFTDGKTVIMGYNTFKSLPKKKPLSNRVNVVVTKNHKDKIPEGFIVIDNITEVIDKYKFTNAVVIGGGYIYSSLISHCKRAYITRVHVYRNGDAKFPVITSSEAWVRRGKRDDSEGNLSFSFETYENVLVPTF